MRTSPIGGDRPLYPQAPYLLPGPGPINQRFSNEYIFPDSNNTGRRKALFIGINYFNNRKIRLQKCINDVKTMSLYLLRNFGYLQNDMIILTDDQQHPMSQPTKQNILRAMHWLIKDARPNDWLFFHYSGHGGQTVGNEVIIPVDFSQVGCIFHDEMYRIMVQPLQSGVQLTTIFDSYHSGTSLEFSFIGR